MLQLSQSVLDAIKKARDFFGIKEFPGNFFDIFEKEIYMKTYNIFIFKEDIGKLSGFIGYGESDIVSICVNYKRSIGHQNFTLAHEVGHMFMHAGKNISDLHVGGYASDNYEREANEFAKELLYPERYFYKDYQEMIQLELFRKEKRVDLAIWINEICHKYCLSFEMVLRRILYCAKAGNEYKRVNKEIVRALGCNISEYFDKDFYLPNDSLAQYQRSEKPYIFLENKIDQLVADRKIGIATAESIKLRNGLIE